MSAEYREVNYAAILKQHLLKARKMQTARLEQQTAARVQAVREAKSAEQTVLSYLTTLCAIAELSKRNATQAEGNLRNISETERRYGMDSSEIKEKVESALREFPQGNPIAKQIELLSGGRTDNLFAEFRGDTIKCLEDIERIISRKRTAVRLREWKIRSKIIKGLKRRR